MNVVLTPITEVLADQIQVGAHIVIKERVQVYAIKQTETAVSGKMVKGSFKIQEETLEVYKTRNLKRGKRLYTKNLSFDMGGPMLDLEEYKKFLGTKQGQRFEAYLVEVK